MNQLQGQIDLAISIQEILRSEITETISACAYNSIQAKTCMQHDGLRIYLKHETLNWADFVTVTYEQNRWDKEDSGFVFDFSHGSGGWEKADPAEILNATLNIFNITEALRKTLSSMDDLIKRFITNGRTIDELYRKDREIKSAEIQAELLEELSSKYTQITGDETLELLRNQSYVDIIRIEGKNKSVYLLENRGSRYRINLYINKHSSTKADLINFIDSEATFLVETK